LKPFVLAAMAPKDTSYRVLLPSDVVPEYYALTLEPDLEKFTFDGVVKITCDVQVATDEVTVHAKELMMGEIKFTPSGGGAAMTACKIVLEPKKTTCTIGFDEVLPVGKGELEIKFRGCLNDQMAGFYRSSYTDSKGEKKFLATTQFEAIDARRCFPCWDEPARKAVFEVTLIYPAHLTAISNMPQSRSDIQKDGKRCDVFMPSPKMSTYLLAFCVGEFEFISGSTQGGVVARIFACPGNVQKVQYALKCCVRALDFYDEFFGIRYPLPKLDMIAIPDFSAGAMENWGLVTYREVTLLCDEATVSAVQKQRICTVITHELAHQWFGNLVTMGWWDDLWLNEGFANWMQTFAADKLHPEWNLWESYVGTEQQRALQLDAMRSSHPIQVPIKEAVEVEEVFDAISYSKGGSVVRMIYSVLGEAKFQEGLRVYFQKHQYGNTETLDLWKAWSEVSGKAIDEMMGSWTEQMGFPLLKVLKDPLESGASEVEVEQSWFLADGSSQPGDDAKTWFVPVICGSDKGTSPVSFLEGSKAGKISCGDCAKGAAWLKLNHGQNSPLRVLYPPSMVTKLSANLSSLPAEDRLGLLSDTYALCRAGQMDPAILVELLKGYTSELNDKVWSELATCLNGLDKVMRQGLSSETHAAFNAFAVKLFEFAWKEVGPDSSPSDSDNTKSLRTTLWGLMGHYCSKEDFARSEALKRFRAFIAAPDDSKALSADIRSAVLGIAMVSSGVQDTVADFGGPAAVFDQLVEAHDKVTDGAVRQHVYAALGKSPTPEMRKRALELCLTDTVRSQDMIYIPMAMALSGPEGSQTVFDWVKSDYDRIYKRLGATSMMLFQHVVRISGFGFVTEARALEVEAFWKGKEVYKAVQKALAQTIEKIRSDAKFLERLGASAVAKPEGWPA
jgi:aminopeptidase N